MGSETCETFFDDDVVDDTGSDGDGRRDWPFEPVPLYDEVEVPPSSERDRGGNSDPGDRGEGRRGVVHSQIGLIGRTETP